MVGKYQIIKEKNPDYRLFILFKITKYKNKQLNLNIINIIIRY